MTNSLDFGRDAIDDSVDSELGWPNAFDTTDGQHGSRLWLFEQGSDIFVVFKSGQEDSSGALEKDRIGWVAISELTGKDLDETYYALIDAATSPATEPISEKIRTIMGRTEKLPEPDSFEIRAIEDKAKARRFNTLFSRYAELPMDEVEALGLSEFVRDPIAKAGHAWVYAVAANMLDEADNGYPAIRYYISGHVWQHRTVSSREMIGFSADSTRDQIRTLSKGADWQDSDELHIKQITLTLADQRQVRSST